MEDAQTRSCSLESYNHGAGGRVREHMGGGAGAVLEQSEEDRVFGRKQSIQRSGVVPSFAPTTPAAYALDGCHVRAANRPN